MHPEVVHVGAAWVCDTDILDVLNCFWVLSIALCKVLEGHLQTHADLRCVDQSWHVARTFGANSVKQSMDIHEFSWSLAAGVVKHLHPSYHWKLPCGNGGALETIETIL